MERKFPPIEKLKQTPQHVVQEANVEVYMNRIMDLIISQIKFAASMGIRSAMVTPRMISDVLRQQPVGIIATFFHVIGTPDSFTMLYFADYNLQVAIERVIQKLHEAYGDNVHSSDKNIVVNLK